MIPQPAAISFDLESCWIMLGSRIGSKQNLVESRIKSLMGSSNSKLSRGEVQTASTKRHGCDKRNLRFTNLPKVIRIKHLLFKMLKL